MFLAAGRGDPLYLTSEKIGDLTSWSGCINDVRIYRKSLASDEVMALRNEQYGTRDGAGAVTIAGRM
jgi:hypothetical protein